MPSASSIAALYRLAETGSFDRKAVAQAIKDLGINPEKADPFFCVAIAGEIPVGVQQTYNKNIRHGH